MPRAAVVKVQRKNISSTLEIASEFLPYQEIDVYAKVSGYIQKLYVDWGTHVKQGQLLAVLEIPELQQQLLQDEASVRRADQEVSRAREEQSRAESAYSVAHVTYRASPTYRNRAPSLSPSRRLTSRRGRTWKPARASHRRRMPWPPPNKPCSPPKPRWTRTKLCSPTRA